MTTPVPFTEALKRGLKRRCPKCGEGPAFNGYLRIVEACPVCGEELDGIRADDGPAYVTMFLVGMLMIPFLWVQIAYQPPTWLALSIWLPVTTAVTLGLLPVVKGGFLAAMWALKLRGTEHIGAQPDSSPFQEDWERSRRDDPPTGTSP